METTIKAKSKHNWQVLAVTMLAAFVVTTIPSASFASEDGGIGGMLCDIAEWFRGPTGKAIATIAVIFLGIAAFFGKVTWGLAIMFALGIFAIFGASEIVNAISDSEAGGGCSSS